MKSRTRSRKPASIGSNHSSRRPTSISPSEPRAGNFVLLVVMAWSPPAHNAGIVWVSAPGDYATFNSNHTPDGTVQPQNVGIDWLNQSAVENDALHGAVGSSLKLHSVPPAYLPPRPTRIHKARCCSLATRR